MNIRNLQVIDKSKLLDLYCETINTVNLKDYSESQVKMWGNRDRLRSSWDSSFEDKEVFVAEDKEKLLGFCELGNDGYIDRFYVEADSVGKGVDSKLFKVLETTAISKKIKMLYSNASITAKPFFVKLGFSVVAEQKVFIEDVEYINYRVEKQIVCK